MILFWREDMSVDGIEIFRVNYQNIYCTFESIIHNELGGKEKEFFDYLVYMYGLVKIEDNGKKLSECINKAYSMTLGRHPFFTFLFWYAPNLYPIMPPSVNELEEALGSPNIIFENREKTILLLLKNDGFWYKYLELEAAINLAKEGCQVKVLHRDNSQVRYFDLEVIFNQYHFNIEVSNRLYHIVDKRTMFNALRNKIAEEAEQLPREGLNVLILFMSDALIFSHEIDSEKKLNIFDLEDIAYGESGSEERGGITIVFGKPKDAHEKPKRKLILETNEKLRHVGALIIWYHGQSLLANLGKQSRLIIPYTTDVFPNEIKDIFMRIQQKDIKR